MSAVTRGSGAGGRADERAAGEADTHVRPQNKVIFVQSRVYPRLMIGGVYRMSFAMGLAVYALPACAASISRHRARLHVRRARQALQHTITHPDANLSARDGEPSATTNQPKP